MQVNPNASVAEGAIDFSYLGYFWGFGVAAGLHILLSKVFPAQETMIHKTRANSAGDEA
jgi:NCS1 family nucleobase:cation symporter-1